MGLSSHVETLLKIIKQRNMGNYFGVHAAHRHDAVPIWTVRFEADLGINGFTWTQPIAIKNPDPAKMHATFFKVGQDGLFPFEFAEGSSPVDITKVLTAFIAEFAAYIAKHELANLIVLEVGDFTKCLSIDVKSKGEIEVQWGENTAFLKPGAGELIRTGWTVPGAPGAVEPDGEPDPGTHWLKVEKPKDIHKVYVNSVEPVTLELLVQKFGEQSIIVA